MSRPVLAVLLAAALASPPIAAVARAEDGRLRSVSYAADEVVRVEGRRGFQSMVQFAPDERIENVALGDSTAWQVTPNKRANMLFVKPMTDDRTNMTVVTDRRTYLFDLVAAPARSQPVYALRFTYPLEAASPASPAPEAPVLKAGAPPAPLRLNFGWTAAGDPTLVPGRVFDDGVTTYLSWSAKAELPAVLTPGEDGAEAPVNFATRDGVMEIDQVPGTLILRAGDRRAVLTRTPRAPAAAAGLTEH